MANIKDFKDNDKNLLEFWEWISPHIANPDILTNYTKEEDGLGVCFRDPTGQGFDENCPFHMPLALKEIPRTFKRKKKDPPPEKPTVYCFRKSLRKGYVSPMGLQTYTHYFANSMPVLAKQTEDGLVFFEGRRKGGKKYNMDMADKIRETSEILYSKYKYSAFLTLTDANQGHGEDIIEQWRNFRSSITRLLKNISRTFDCSYVCVLEAHKSGYAHAHAVLFFKNKLSLSNPIYHKHSIAWKNGDAVDYIASHWWRGFFLFETSKQRKPVSYLIKYITKASVMDFKKIGDEHHTMTASERKACLTTFIPVLAKTRGISTTQISEEEREAFRADRIKKMEERLAQKKRREVHGAPHASTSPGVCVKEEAHEVRPIARSAKLDMSSINFPQSCIYAVRGSAFREFSKVLGRDISSFSDLSEEEAQQMWEHMKPMSCGGCVLSHLVHEIMTKNDDWFHKANKYDYYDGVHNVHTKEENKERKNWLKLIDERALAVITPKEYFNYTMYKTKPEPKININCYPSIKLNENSGLPGVDPFSLNREQRIERYMRPSKPMRVDVATFDDPATGEMIEKAPKLGLTVRTESNPEVAGLRHPMTVDARDAVKHELSHRDFLRRTKGKDLMALLHDPDKGYIKDYYDEEKNKERLRVLKQKMGLPTFEANKDGILDAFKEEDEEHFGSISEAAALALQDPDKK